MKNLWVIFFLSVQTLRAFGNDAPTIKVEFLDKCSGRPTAVRSDAGLWLELNFQGLDPTLSLDVDVEVSPPRSPEGEMPFHIKIADHQVERDGTAKIRREVNLPTEESLFTKKIPRIWTATVHWEQEGRADLSGADQNTVYLARPDETKFFQIINTQERSPYVCLWESGARMVSQYQFNQTAATKTVSLDLPYLGFDPGYGMDIGALPAIHDSAEHGPLFPPQQKDKFRGWIIPSWLEAYGTTGPWKMTKSEPILQGRGGVFVQRIVYTRFLTQEYHLQRKNRPSDGECSTWAKGEVGWVDFSVPRDDFVYIPEEKSSHREDMLEYINTVKRPVDTCVVAEKDWLSRAELRSLVPATKGDLAMYFYPVSSVDADKVTDDLLLLYRAKLVDSLNALKKPTDESERFGHSWMLQPLRRALGEQKAPEIIPAALSSILSHPKFNPNRRDVYGFTLLMMAAAISDEKAMSDLLKHPAIDVNLRVIPPKRMASLKTYLETHTTLSMARIFATQNLNYKAYKKLITDPRLDINAPIAFYLGDEKGQRLATPFIEAVSTDRPELVRPILQRTDLKIKALRGFGMTPAAMLALDQWGYTLAQNRRLEPDQRVKDPFPRVLSMLFEREDLVNQKFDISNGRTAAHRATYSLAKAIVLCVKLIPIEEPLKLKIARGNLDEKPIDEARDEVELASYVLNHPKVDLEIKGSEGTPADFFFESIRESLTNFSKLTPDLQAEARWIIRRVLRGPGITAFYRLSKSLPAEKTRLAEALVVRSEREPE